MLTGWGFHGPTLTLDQQRSLFRGFVGWTSGWAVHLVGLLALLHGATTRELQHLTGSDIESAHAWYHSTEYRPLRELRHRSATADAIFIAASFIAASSLDPAALETH